MLVIDDHELFLKNIARDFARQGVEVLKATTHADAVRLCEAEHPDLAIIDLFLEPPEDGLELVRALKAIDPHLFAILVSAHMSVAHAVMCVRAGADDVFLKPFKAVQALARFSGEAPLTSEQTLTLHQIEWEHISRALQDYDGNITRAAEALGVFRQSLQRKMKRHAPRVLLEHGDNEQARAAVSAERPGPVDHAKPTSLREDAEDAEDAEDERPAPRPPRKRRSAKKS